MKHTIFLIYLCCIEIEMLSFDFKTTQINEKNRVFYMKKKQKKID